MSITRRFFFRSAAAFSLLAAAARRGGSAQSTVISTFDAENTANLEGITEERLKRFVGERFTVRQDARSYGYVTLIAVDNSAAPSNSNKVKMVGPIPATHQPFVVNFAAQFQGSGAPLQQGTYTLRNDGLGSFPLFLVPSASGSSPVTYTAVFNILVHSSQVIPPIRMPHSIER